MELNQSRWFVKLFFWTQTIWHAFWDTWTYTLTIKRGLQEVKPTSLCYFVQTTFVWVPLILLAQVALWTLVLTALIFYPIYNLGAGGYGLVIGSIVAGAIGTVLFVYGVQRLAEWHNNRPDRPARTEPSAWSVAKEYLAAKKAHVCPIITFTTEGSDAESA